MVRNGKVKSVIALSWDLARRNRQRVDFPVSAVEMREGVLRVSFKRPVTDFNEGALSHLVYLSDLRNYDFGRPLVEILDISCDSDYGSIRPRDVEGEGLDNLKAIILAYHHLLDRKSYRS